MNIKLSNSIRNTINKCEICGDIISSIRDCYTKCYTNGNKYQYFSISMFKCVKCSTEYLRIMPIERSEERFVYKIRVGIEIIIRKLLNQRRI